MSKRIITSCFIMFCTFSIFSLDLPLFPLVLSQSDTELDISIENINSMFASGLIAADKQKIFTPAIVNIDQENNQSSLFLRAVGYCKSKRIPFCAFGTIEFLNSIYELKVSVYDSNTESIVKTFYVKGDCLDLPILIKQLSLSIIQYAYKSLEISYIEEYYPASLNLEIDTGYWCPLLVPDVTTSLFYFGAGVEVNAKRPIESISKNIFYPGFGVNLLYGLGVSKPYFEPSTYHFIRLRLPLEGHFVISDFLNLTIGLIPEFEVSLAHIERRYAEAELLCSSTGGVGLSGAVDMKLGNKNNILLSLKTGADFITYSPLLVNFWFGISTTIQLMEF